MNKIDTFEQELNLIKDDNVRKFTSTIISKLPDYFFTCAASSTGKYHPQYALGEGGLVRHTKAAIVISQMLIELEMFDKIKDQNDYIVSALILHDGLKHGLNGSKFTVDEHPKLMGDHIIVHGAGFAPIPSKISELIHSHMGQWNKGTNSSKEILPKPITSAQKFVHLCDYLASRKRLEVLEL